MAGKPRILIIDDEPTILLALQRAFAGRDWHIEVATSIATARERHGKAAYDLLLVDKILPDGDGVDLVRALRAARDRVCAVVMSGYTTVDVAVDALNLGIDGFLEKPFDDLDYVARLVERSLAGRIGPAPGAPVTAAPARPPTPTPAPAPAPAAAATATPRGGLYLFRVLVVAADAKTREKIAARVQVGKDIVVVQATLPEVIDLVDRSPPAAVVLHGELDILPLVEMLRFGAPEVACVVLSEQLPLPAVTHLIRLQVKSLITEPVDSPRFARRLTDVLGHVRAAHKP